MASTSFIDQCLEEQARLTPVERFAALHDAAVADGDGRAYETRYRELIPNVAPGPGEQYAFEVDLDRCTGCKACVTGCHSRNGLAEGETWRKIASVPSGRPAAHDSAVDPVGWFPQTVTTACHHCAEPGCLEGCPVLAYEKDAATGVVVHLDDQCIGCQYCTMKCPYDVPQYDAERGIVRKCDMCLGRLNEGEAPACVQSCPNEAIRILAVDRDRAVHDSAAAFASAVPGAPDPAHTRPTTIYRSARAKNTTSDGPERTQDEVVAPQHAHLPLVAMLVLTQASVGTTLAGRFVAATGGGEAGRADSLSLWLAAGAALLGAAGIAASLLHLGRPLYAFRAVLGIRTSWLSREIVAFGVYLTLSMLHAAIVAVRTHAPSSPFSPIASASLADATAWGALAAGAFGIACSAMVYFDTPRPVWASPRTPALFGSTAIVTAAFVALLSSAATATVPLALLLGTALAAVAAKLTVELCVLTPLTDASLWRHTARVMTERLGGVTTLRIALGVSAPISAILAVTTPDAASAVAYSALAVAQLVAGELAERYLFFAAVPPSRMPGLDR